MVDHSDDRTITQNEVGMAFGEISSGIWRLAMTKLDRVFGPRRERTDEERQNGFSRGGGTNYPEAEERIREVLDKWDQITGFHPDRTDKKVRSVLKSAARDFVNAIGERPDLLEAAIGLMRKKGLVPSTPRSAISFARELKQGFLWDQVDPDSEGARRRYLKES